MIQNVINQTTCQGYDEEKIAQFYQSHFNEAKQLGYTDDRADDLAKYMVNYYKHQFRNYK